jgi:hypothetical protein
MEQSGHWPGLRDIAVTLQKQISAPLHQLLGLGEWGIHNSCLILESSCDQLIVTLKVEEEPLFSALREHLPDNPAWDILGNWKQKVKEIRRQLSDLCEWVTSQSGVVDKNRIAPGESARRTPGLRDRYAQTVVMIAAEDTYFNRPIDDSHRRSLEQRYKIAQPSVDGDLGTLKLEDGSTTYLLASSQEPQELEALRRRHMELCITMRDLAQLQQVVEDFRRLGQLAQNLVNEMSRIEKLAMFPGSCDLCSI